MPAIAALNFTMVRSTAPHARSFTLSRLAVLLGLAAACLIARAEGGQVSSPRLPAHQAECAACHIAYPPGLLGAKSWQQIMTGLSKHFGVDASLDAGSTKTIADWLTVHAGTGRRFSTPPPDNRITKSNWFVREHDEVSASVFKRPAVGGASNCAACHLGAADGNFDEHEVRIPK